MTNFLSKSEEITIDFAKEIANTLKNRDILLIKGTLGAGKTVFTRGLLRFLCQSPDMDVPSPTFTLVQYYDSENFPIYHFDLYRLEDPEEIYELGWEDAVSGGVTIVEWPERLGHLTPARYLDIEIKTDQNNEHMRHISYEWVGV